MQNKIQQGYQEIDNYLNQSQVHRFIEKNIENLAEAMSEIYMGDAPVLRELANKIQEEFKIPSARAFTYINEVIKIIAVREFLKNHLN